MRASFPPFSKQPANEQPEISDRESKLRTLKHYLYHAGLLVDELLAADSHVAPQFASCGVVAADAPYSFGDGGAETILPLRRNADGSLAIDGTAADFTRDRDATGA